VGSNLQGIAMRIVFVGDTHYCIPREHTGPREGPGTLPDHLRYTPMTRSVLEPLLTQVREAEPDLVISSGDFVEGGLRGHPSSARREVSEGLAYFTELGVPFLIARGTHDAVELFAEVAVPAISRSIGREFAETYLRHDAGDCTFLILDYQRYALGNSQDEWLEAQLADAAATDRRIFVVAHAPIFLWGRHFFGEPALIERLDSLLTAYPVEAYLCGHTHNQVVSFHARQGELGWLQLMASSVGYPAMAPVPVESVHCLADFGPDNTYLWGILEDSSPGLFIIDLKPDGMHLCRRSVAGEMREFSVAGKRTMPRDLGGSRESPAEAVPEDFLQIKSAVLGVFGYGQSGPPGQVRINGVGLVGLPENGSYAARRFLPLPSDALLTLDRRNTISITTPELAEFAIGSLSLELTLLDGRVLRSTVAPDILVAGERWQRFPGARKLITCSPGDEREVTVTF